MTNLPVPKDPVATAIEKSIEEAAKAAKDYADKLFSPAVENVGGFLGDRVGLWRFKNRIEIILKAKRFLETKGIDPRKVLPKAALPIIETGSTEDSAEMRDKWAAMLAHAANPGEPDLLPALPKILGEMSHQEVKVLDKLCELHHYKSDDWGWIPFEASEFQEYCELIEPGMDPYQSIVLMENMERLGIIESGEKAEWIGKEKMDSPLLITRLGFELVDKCRFP